MQTDSIHSIFHSARRFFTGTLLSRISGAIRDICMAASFGSSPEIATFMVAYRLANLFRRLLGEGNLSSTFVPVFESLRTSGIKNSFRFYRDTIFSYTIILIFLVLLLQFLCIVIAPHTPPYRNVLNLSFWMLPGLLFIILSSLNTAFLQCQKKYLSSSIGPVGFNIIWIISIFLIGNQNIEKAVELLSIAITIAFAGQWIITAIHVRKEIRKEISRTEWLKPHLFSPDFKRLIKPMGLSVIGIGAMQINSTLDVIFAQIADLSGPAYLWYAIRIQQLPLSLFGVALAGALLPPLARAAQEQDGKHYHILLNGALKKGLTLMIPLTFACLSLSSSGIDLLYGRGQFSPESIEKTMISLWGYTLGLVPSTITLLLASGFYAQTTYLTPVKGSLISVVCNLFLNTLFILGLGWGAPSVATATGISAIVNTVILARSHQWNINSLNYLGKIMLSASLACIFSLFIGHVGGIDGTISIFYGKQFLFCKPLINQMGQFFSMNIVYWSSFLGIARLMNIEEIFSLFKRAKVPTV